MNFNMTIEEPQTESYKNIIERVAIRAVIIKNHHILLVHSSRGDFKFPGGGVEKNENHEDCLLREIREETGYINCAVKDKVGTIIERKKDDLEENALFQMISHYYLCGLVTEDKEEQQLDDYEAVLEYTPKWVPLDEAIQQNEILMDKFEQNNWLKRETYVLKQLRINKFERSTGSVQPL
ncbi:NUDIX hydrolase [Mesobacillus selenatarsenatis]|uniref:NUDIX domain-containing protein n=1 Tax=Mesobacillus selenatarsenatis TaxID=388741 RepID=A0A846T5A5_9BACI|nr:NUDIX domain-containing protein [Mesobacillus selenatarsenatis]NKE04038.1 NUDIX domain-containing protein [Mesobacillus selenatarsenatis]